MENITTNEEWTVLLSSLEFDKKIPSLVRQCKKKSYNIFVMAKHINEMIKQTGDLNETRQEFLKTFFS